MQRLLKGRGNKLNTTLQVLTLADCRVGNVGASALGESLLPLPKGSAVLKPGLANFPIASACLGALRALDHKHPPAILTTPSPRYSNGLRILDLTSNAIGPAGAFQRQSTEAQYTSIFRMRRWFVGCMLLISDRRAPHGCDYSSSLIECIGATALAEALSQNEVLQVQRCPKHF